MSPTVADPRLSSVLTTVNQELFDRAIRHAIYLERLKTSEVRSIVGFLNDKVFPDLFGRLMARLDRIEARGFDLGPRTTDRLENLFRGTDAIIRKGKNELQKRLVKSMGELAVAEAEWQVAAIRQAIPIDITMNIPELRMIRSVVRSRPMQGKLMRDWWRDWDLDARRNVRQQIQLGMAQGESVPRMVRRIRGTVARQFEDGSAAQIRRNAETIVRTSASHTATHARQATFEENDDLLKGVQWVATLDTRTCPICMPLDGKVFKVDSGERPPIHPQCRCTVTPVVKSWKELGIDLKEAPEGTRASMDGQVPSSVTYEKWLRQQDANPKTRGRVEEALGSGRAKIWRERGGKGFTVSDLVDQRNRPLTLKQIRAAEGI